MSTMPNCLLLILVLYRPISVIGAPIPAGVPLHAPGHLNVIVGDSEMNVDVLNPAACMGSFEFWYPVERVLGPAYAVPGNADMCSLRVEQLMSARGYATACPLRRKHDNSMEIDVKTIPSGCQLYLTNAKLAELSSTETSKVFNTRMIIIITAAVVVPVALIIVGGLLAWFVLRPCWRRRQGYQRVPPQSSAPLPPTAPPPQTQPPAAAVNVAAAPKQPVPPPSLPPPPSTPIVAPTKKQEPPPPKEEKKAATKPSTAAPPPPVASNPEIKKVVPPAPSTMEDVDFDFGERKKTTPEPRRKPKWDGVPFSGDRAFEDYNDLADRGSALTPTPADSKGSRKSKKSKKSKKRDSMELYSAPVESAIESMARHRLFEPLKNEAIVCSLRDDNPEPQEFKAIRKRYADLGNRARDPREMELVTTPAWNVFKLLNDYRNETKLMLEAAGAEFPTDGSRPHFTEAARAVVASHNTPTPMMLAALALELGFLVPTHGENTRERTFENYSAQLLLVVAMRHELPEDDRREAVSHFVSRVFKSARRHDDVTLHMMAFPLNLTPEAKVLNPAFYKDPTLGHVDEPAKGKSKRCCKKKVASTTETKKESTEATAEAGKSRSEKKLKPPAAAPSAEITELAKEDAKKMDGPKKE